MAKEIDVSSVNFSDIKQALKDTLKNQTEFSDYNFEGSAINVILDILAYNTHMNVMHTNMAFNETFLDSATKRNSIVSRAKELGYVPSSKQSSRALVTLNFSVTGNPLQYVIPKNTKFTSTSGNDVYTFQTNADILVNNLNNIFTKTIEIFEGNRIPYDYTVDSSDLSQRFIIPSKSADISSLSVTVKPNNSSTALPVEYTYIDKLSIGNLDATTKVYFLQESYDGFYEVYFGNGVIGTGLENGNVITLTYNISSGDKANDLSTFVMTSTLPNVTNLSLTTNTNSFGGSERESTDSIKYLAPFYYQSQKRAVTEDDYKALIKKIYPNIDDVAVWGGEKNDPPYYGKVFIAIKPKATYYFSNNIKQKIQNDFISNYNVVSVRPEIVDPDYINVSVYTTVIYNARLYNNNTSQTLESIIRENINTFFADESNKFGKPLYFSKLQNVIDSSNDMILSTNTNLVLEKEKQIFTGISGKYEFDFNNSIEVGSLTSNEFTIEGTTFKFIDIPAIVNDAQASTGTIAVYRVVDGVKVYYNKNVGMIDYNTGKVIINNLKIDSIVEDPILSILRVSVGQGNFINTSNPSQVYTDYNVYTNDRNQVITLAENGIFITLIPDESV